MRRDNKRIAKRRLNSVDALLGYLCVELGYCDAAGMEFNPLPTVNEFADAVLRAEGIDPLGYCEHKKVIRQIIADSYSDMGVEVD